MPYQITAVANFGQLEWKEIAVHKTILDIIARLSSRVFLGDQLCRDEKWLEITKEYTVTMFTAAHALHAYPRALRKLVHWFVPECKKLRSQFVEAKRVIAPVIDKRRKLRTKAREAGQPVPEFNDALDWANQEAAIQRATCDPASFQLTLSVAAIQSSSDLLEQVMLDLANHQDMFQPLREEIVTALRADGWKKTSLYNMKLLDSVMKESQRMKPLDMGECNCLIYFQR